MSINFVCGDMVVRGKFIKDVGLEIYMEGNIPRENYYEYLNREEVIKLRDHLNKILIGDCVK